MNHILEPILANARRLQAAPCLHYKKGGQWQVMSWKKMEATVMNWACGLIALGLKPGDRVAILSPTRMEWVLADLAIFAAGGIVVPIYPTLTQEQAEYILADADVHVAFLSEPHELSSPHLISFDMTMSRGRFLSLDDLVARGRSVSRDCVEAAFRSLTPQTVATYVYTSGTTGRQKGAILTQGNIVAEIQAALEIFCLRPDEIGLVSLPLAHVLGRMGALYQLAQGCQSAFAESMEKLAENYRDVRPHLTIGVPRMLEKLYERVLETVRRSPSWKRRLFAWGRGVLDQAFEVRRHHRNISLFLQFKAKVADVVIARPLRKRLGGRLRIFVSGGAPLSKEVARFLISFGVTVLEGYGLTETFAAVAVNRPDDFHVGTVGKALSGVQIKIAPDGEILVKGGMVFQGYVNLPEETSAAFEEEGWLKTGDIGEYSKDGFLRITDRKKDLIATAGGKKIAPQPIEALLTRSMYIDQAMLEGDRKPYLVALLTINIPAVEAYGKQQGYETGGALAKQEWVRSLIAADIERVNAQVAQFESIKRFAILPTALTVEAEELTPTLKVRRRAVAEKYRDVIEQLYAAS
ncbi:MAG: long-chain fatty acid--CoA ligase [Deltaproteobacteria bacterium]|nr:long-chain fatty acid--CoA ligase [Deltaproteobacteria bacterium]